MEKLKEIRRLLLLTGGIILLPILAGLCFWNQLPAQMPTHFGIDGTANGFSDKTFAVLGLPLLLLALHLFCTAVICLDPKQRNISRKIFRLVLCICPATSLLVSCLIYGAALGLVANILRPVLLFLGLLFLSLGNYLPKCRQNYTVGIRLPWTLNDEANWDHTHHFAGWVWSADGLLLLVGALLEVGGFWGLLVLCILPGILPIGYSFLYYWKYK